MLDFLINNQNQLSKFFDINLVCFQAFSDIYSDKMLSLVEHLFLVLFLSSQSLFKLILNHVLTKKVQHLHFCLLCYRPSFEIGSNTRNLYLTHFCLSFLFNNPFTKKNAHRLNKIDHFFVAIHQWWVTMMTFWKSTNFGMLKIRKGLSE